MSRLIPFVVAGAVAAGAVVSTGCLGTVRVGGSAHVAEPELAYVSPGVWVVQDYGEPVFYTDNGYWLYRGGVWYRSDVYHSGWVRVRAVPHRVRRIHRPHRYVHYRARAGVRTRKAPARVHHRSRVRDHRTPARRPAKTRTPARTRDHRAPARRPASHKPARVHTRDHRRSAPPPKKTKRHEKRKPKVKTRDHRRD